VWTVKKKKYFPDKFFVTLSLLGIKLPPRVLTDCSLRIAANTVKLKVKHNTVYSSVNSTTWFGLRGHLQVKQEYEICKQLYRNRSRPISM